MGDNRCRVLIIDGQGGRIGKQLAEAIGQDPRIELTAAGTNSAATVNMMKGGVRTAATGENAVVVGCRRADNRGAYRHRDCRCFNGRGYAKDGGRGGTEPGEENFDSC